MLEKSCAIFFYDEIPSMFPSLLSVSVSLKHAQKNTQRVRNCEHMSSGVMTV